MLIIQHRARGRSLLSVGGSENRRAEPPGPLATLLGAQRALILEFLGRPMTAGDLAERLEAGPSTASYHLAALERAGLVDRERDGRHVLVRRTSRGTKLLELYNEHEQISE